MRYIIAATDPRKGIGYENSLPWRFLEDITFFSDQTTRTRNPAAKNAVIMGRNTWYSIPEKHRPLVGRYNIIISKNPIENQIVFDSITNAIEHLEMFDFIEDIYFIGGYQIYKEVIDKKLCDGIFLTHIHKIYKCDTFFPDIDLSCAKVINLVEESGVQLEFKYLDIIQNSEEKLYLDIIREIMLFGNKRMDRTGTGTMSLFGKKMKFDLTNGKIPLLTTKRVYWRGIVEELLWFIKGDTNAKNLQKKNIHIWDGNSSRKYLDSLGLYDNQEGDLGPIYGFQWRHFGAEYTTMHDNYENKGIDQLSELINTIRHNPNDRRMILSAWNPCDFGKMALLPCHIMSQFYVCDGKLSCQMYQRSADMGLGVPFNIASYSLLTHMIAHCTGLETGEFIHIIGDCHVYLNHIAPLTKQIDRVPKKFPTLKIKSGNSDITKFQYSDFEIVGYDPFGNIKMDMSI
jgi:dihydrofolate reductase/thymidylate synthase